MELLHIAVRERRREQRSNAAQAGDELDQQSILQLKHSVSQLPPQLNAVVRRPPPTSPSWGWVSSRTISLVNFSFFSLFFIGAPPAAGQSGGVGLREALYGTAPTGAS
jgi:hypothetical protein